MKTLLPSTTSGQELHRVILRLTPRENISQTSTMFVTLMHVPFEIFHLSLGFIHFSAIQVDVFGQEYII